MRMGGKAEAVNAGISDDSRAKAGTAVRVVELPGERLAEAASVLARAFHDNPNFVDLFPNEGARSHALARMFAAGLRDALGFGHVYAAARGDVAGSAGDELVGVAVWLPPGAFPLSPRRQLRALPGMAGVLAAAPRSAPRLLRYAGGIARCISPTRTGISKWSASIPRRRGLASARGSSNRSSPSPTR